MRSVKLIDSMRDFLMYWRDYSGRDVEEMFNGWLMRYISGYPELLIAEVVYWGDLERLRDKMIRDVLPSIDHIIHDVIETWMIFLQNVSDIYLTALRKFEIPQAPTIAIYVGSGWKPRWTASILDKPALFFDLGGIASLKWIDEHNVRGVMAFSLGQLRQASARGGAEKYAELERNPYFRLYSQGLAQFVENFILDKDSWHGIGGEDWVRRCEERSGEIAREYLKDAEIGSVDQFYIPGGKVMGLGFTGRYLGYRLIRELYEKGLSLEELIRLPESRVVSLSKDFLKKLSRE